MIILTKRKSSPLHWAKSYKAFFTDHSSEDIEELLVNLRTHKEDLEKFQESDLELLIAHSRSIENKQKQLQIIAIVCTIMFSTLTYFSGFFPKPLLSISVILFAFILIVVLVFSTNNVTKEYLQSIVYVTLFRELAEISLKQKQDEKEDTLNSQTETNSSNDELDPE